MPNDSSYCSCNCSCNDVETIKLEISDKITPINNINHNQLHFLYNIDSSVNIIENTDSREDATEYVYEEEYEHNEEQ